MSNDDCDYSIMDKGEYYECITNKLYEKLEGIHKIANEILCHIELIWNEYAQSTDEEIEKSLQRIRDLSKLTNEGEKQNE